MCGVRGPPRNTPALGVGTIYSRGMTSARESGESIRVLYVEADGPAISTPEQTSDLIGNAWMDHADLLAIPVARLDPDFFRLSSGLAGEITQKAVNYQVRLVVLGDVSEWVARSDSFRDFVWESNRGQHVWFVADRAALEAKLAPRIADSAE